MLAGKEYGSGSSRDWAAKGTNLLGVRAVIAESFERIHRSNLVGMGVLPLQFPDGESAESLGLTGEEVFTITGLAEPLNAGALPHDGARCTPATSSSRRACASTRPRRRTTSATAGSCSTCCARWRPDGRGADLGRQRRARPRCATRCPLAVLDPFLYLEDGERRAVVTNTLEDERIAEVAPDVERILHRTSSGSTS